MSMVRRTGRLMRRQPGTAALIAAERYGRRRQSELVLVACMPKSASTMFSGLLATLTGFELKQYSESRKGNAQDLSRAKLIDATGFRSVAQHHVLATTDNLRLAERFGLKIVVQSRNVADALVSLRDHLNTEGTQVPTVWVPPSWAALSEEEQLDFLVASAAPWYFAFQRSWAIARRESGLTIRSVDFDRVVDDPIAVASELITELGLSVLDSAVHVTAESLSRPDETRFNVGRPGRGAEAMTPKQLTRLGELAAFYRRECAT